jgi:molybdopterin synthase catalytic subunit
MSRLTRMPIDVAQVVATVGDAALGGTAVFLGTVRRGGQDGPVRAIEYSAYDEMADAELARIIAEAVTRWPESRVEVQHRLGEIAAGEASIAVVAASPHRAEAFDVCRYVIEEIKVRLPIWKKEIFEDGSTAWRGNDSGRGPVATA